jgi:hypothetical protein
MTTLLICAIIGVILITYFTEKGDLGWTGTIFIGFLAALYFFGDISYKEAGHFFADNSGKLILFGVFYLIAGITWAFLKWRWYCLEMYDDVFRYAYQRGCTEENMQSAATDIKASNNKARITGWMIWWPTSLTWWLLHDPITRFYKFVYGKLEKYFESISSSAKQAALRKRESKRIGK